MRVLDVLNCKFSNWYPLFQEITIKSIIIPLCDEFIAYLQDNGTVVLPNGLNFENDRSLSPEEELWEDSGEKVDKPDFPELIKRMKDVISQLGGKVFPKLNWSAPRDAVWINNNTLKCTSPDEVILLLKSSDFIQFDLSSVFGLCEDVSDCHPPAEHELVFRKWANLSPGMEFRCFIRNKQLVAVSQRDYKQFYEFIEREKEELAEEIHDFVLEKVVNKFPSLDFVVDLYKKRNGNYWVIDFNPFEEITDSLLFTWTELLGERLSDSEASVELVSKDGRAVGQFRYADRDSTLQPSEYLSYRIPVDFVDLSTGADATKLIDFMRMKIQNDESSESEDEEWKLPR